MRRAANNFDGQRLLLRSMDALLVIMTSSVSYAVMPVTSFGAGIEYPLFIIVGGLLLPAIGDMLGLYEPWRGRSLFTMLGAYCLAWSITIAVVSVVLVLTQYAYLYSRMWMAVSAITALFCGLLYRTIMYVFLRHMRSRGHNLKMLLLVGEENNIRQIRERLSLMPDSGYRIADEIVVEDRLQALAGIQTLLNEALQYRRFNEVWLTFPLSEGEWVKSVADQLILHPVTLRYFPDFSDVRLLNHRITQVADLYSIELNHSPLDGISRWIKLGEDLFLGTLLFILCFPIMLIIASILLCQRGGPVLFKQYRHGQDGKQFRIYKFRTMYLHSEHEVTQAKPNDQRITPFGAWLRRTSLDELPQLYNVLQGRMSLVGPRPHALDHNYYYRDVIVSYMQRHRVKPGMTGWAQIHGFRGRTETVADMQKRVDYDFHYINHWSLGLDLKILLLTLWRGLLNHQP